MALDPADADAHAVLTIASISVGEMSAAEERARLAKSCNPGPALAWAAEGWVLLYTGRPDEARDSLNAALRLDPHGPLNPAIIQQVVNSYYYIRDYEKAIETARHLIARHPDYPLTYRVLAAALGQAGHIEEAAAALHEAGRRSPQALAFHTNAKAPLVARGGLRASA